MTSPMNSIRKVSDNKESILLRQTCEKLLAFLDQARNFSEKQRKMSGVMSNSVGSLRISKILDCGLELVGESRAPRSATLQIFCDPPRFERWRDRQGNLDLFYANPYGIEIVLQRGSWGFFVDEQRLPLDLRRKERYLASLLGISQNPNGIEVSFLTLGDSNESSPDQITAPSASLVASPRFLLDTEREEYHASRESSGALERLLASMA